MPLPVSVFLVTLLSTFPHKIQANSPYATHLIPPPPPPPFYSCKPVTDQLTTERLYNLPKLLFFCKTTLQQYFVENARDYNQFAKTMSKSNILVVSFRSHY